MVRISCSQERSNNPVTVAMDSGVVPATRQFDYARDVIRHSLALDFRAGGEWDKGHWGRGSINSLGPVQAMVATAGPARVSVERTPAFIRQFRSDTYKVELLLSGDLVVAQDDREAVLRPGDLAICDMTRPMCLGLPGRAATQVMALLVPRTLVPVLPDDVARSTAVPLSGQGGAPALASALLERLAGQLDEYGPADGVRISTVVIDLITAILAARLEQPALLSPDRRRRVLLQQVYAYVEERLDDPHLTPGSIAIAQHISVRSLYKLFESEGVTLSEWIRHRRLARCRRDLCDPEQLHRTVSAIGASWGFTDPTHFGRVFRSAHGTSPREYRLLHRGNPP